MPCCYVFSLIHVLIEPFLPGTRPIDVSPETTLRARSCLSHRQNAMKNPTPATAPCHTETQRSFQQQHHRGKLLRKVSPFFHLGVFSLYHLQESPALAPSSSTFSQICDTSLSSGSCSQNRQFSLLFLAKMSTRS